MKVAHNINKIKIGDFVVCIKIPPSKTICKLYGLYKINNIYDEGYVVIINDDLYFSGFELLEPKSNFHFFKYFITLQQYRKLKLKKLKNG